MKRKSKNFWLILKKKRVKLIILAVVFVLELIFPQFILADSTNLAKNSDILNMEELNLPLPPKESPKKTVFITVTAYSSTIDQTDNTPCLTANNYNLCENNEENAVATNFLPFGTKIKIPEYFGDQEFFVQDRMNKRYTNRIDIWMKTKKAAKEFGIRKLKVEIY